MARSLTARQQQAYDFIHDKIALQGYGPTVREIGDCLGIKSPNGVMCHLRALERKGMIRRFAHKSRAIEIADPADLEQVIESQPLPKGSLAVRGCVAKGMCRLYDAPLPFDLTGVLQNTQRYLLQYSGHDLCDYSIADGDMLVVEPSGKPSSEALTLVQCPDGSIELKTPQTDDEVALSADVIGLVVGVLRIHRPSVAIRAPHMQQRKAQLA